MAPTDLPEAEKEGLSVIVPFEYCLAPVPACQHMVNRFRILISLRPWHMRDMAFVKQEASKC